MKKGSSLSPPTSHMEGFRIPIQPTTFTHNTRSANNIPTLASSYMEPRNIEDYSKLIRFSRREGYLYRLTKASSSSSSSATSGDTKESGEGSGEGSGNTWKKRYLVLHDGYLYIRKKMLKDLFALIQTALQSGPMAGSKPGKFHPGQ